MPRQYYFTIFSHCIDGKTYILRLDVQRESGGRLIDHYYEYGTLLRDSLMLGDSLWSSDPDALIDQIPPEDRFHASMDVRLFLRTDLEDALDGSLMTDEFEIILDGSRFIACPELASPPLFTRS